MYQWPLPFRDSKRSRGSVQRLFCLFSYPHSALLIFLFFTPLFSHIHILFSYPYSYSPCNFSLSSAHYSEPFLKSLSLTLSLWSLYLLFCNSTNSVCSSAACVLDFFSGLRLLLFTLCKNHNFYRQCP